MRSLNVRCSSCSSPVRPVVAIDIDGTLADYHGHLHSFAEGWIGHDLRRDYDGSEPFRYWVERWWGLDHTAFRALKLAFRQGGMKRTMPIYPGAAELIEEVMMIGAEVWLTTTRPWERFDRVDPDTREWLRRHAISYDGLLYDDDKLDALCERIEPRRIVAVLDDQRDILMAAASRSLGPIMRETPYNRGNGWKGTKVPSLMKAMEEINWRVTAALERIN